MDISDSQSVALPLRPLMPGTRVQGSAGTYVIQEYLGLGLTSFVYKAQLEGTDTVVALKVLRSDASPVSTKHFWHEATILAELRDAHITNVAQLIDHSKEQDDIRFLALEYLDSSKFQPLDRLLEGGPLPGGEQAALSLVAQALELLDQLHTKVERTYVDMQLKNFWWDQETQTLKVIDWNHVSSRRGSIREEELERFGVQGFDDLARRDLARFAAYFYRMLTGKGAMERGETVHELASRAGWAGPFKSSGVSKWEKDLLVPVEERGPVSIAARQVVVRALCQYPGYLCARDFLADVRHVQELWTEEIDEKKTLQAIYEYLDGAREAQAGQDEPLLPLADVEARMDILERRGVQVRPRYWEKLYEVTRGISALWGSGSLYYQADQYAEAARKWEEEAKAQGRADLWRWVVLAQTGMTNPQGFSAIRDKLEMVVGALAKDNLPEAQGEFTRIASANPWVRESAAMMIGWEIYAAFRVEKGRELEAIGDEKADLQSWQEAATAYRQASEALEKISLEPYRLALRRERNWEDLLDRAGELDRRRDAHSRTSSEIPDIRRALEEDFKGGLTKLRFAFIRTPDHQGLISFCWEYANSKTQPRDALEIVDRVRLWARMGEDERAKWESLHRQIWKQIYLTEFDSLASQIEEAARQDEWGDAKSHAATILSIVRGTERYQQLQAALRNIFQSSYEQELLTWAEQADQVLALIDPAGLQERTRALNELRSRWKEENEQLEATHSQQRQTLKETVEELRQARQQRDFVKWITDKRIGWVTLLQQRGPEGYSEVITEIETVLQEMELKFGDLGETEDYKKAQKEMRSARELLRTKLDERNESQNRLGKANRYLRDALQELGKLTPESLQAARTLLTEAQDVLKDVPPAHEPLRQEQLRDEVQTCIDLVDHITSIPTPQGQFIIDLVQQTRGALEEMKGRLEQRRSPQDVGEMLTLAVQLCRNVNKHINQRRWAQRLPVESQLFPALTELTQEVAYWQKMLPFSKSKGSAPVDVGVIKETLASELCQQVQRVEERIQQLERTVQEVKNAQPRGFRRWGPWVLATLGLLTGLTALAIAVTAHLRLGFAPPPSITPTATITLTATSMPTHTPTPTLTPTIIPTPAPPPPFDAVEFALEDGLLYDLPSLTLRPREGWAFEAETITNTPLITQLPIVAPDQQRWAIEIVLVGPTGSVEAQAGRAELLEDGSIRWQPDETRPPLLPGQYRLYLRAAATDGGVQESRPRLLSITEPPLRVVLLEQGVVRYQPQTGRCNLVDPPIPTGTMLEVLGQVSAQVGTQQITLLQVRVSGLRPLYWVPTGRGGAMEGAGVYVGSEGGQPLPEALQAVPLLEGVAVTECP